MHGSPSEIRTRFPCLQIEIARIKANCTNAMSEIVYREESYKIIGACMEVHRKLGPGFLESVYSEALEIEFKNAGIPYEKEKKLPVYYDDQPLHKYFRADYLCYNSIVLELKAQKLLSEADKKQTFNNIKATKFKLGLLVNFGEPSLRYPRFVNTTINH
jgi:GxxExxY protein